MVVTVKINQRNIRETKDLVAQLKRMPPELQKEVSQYMYKKIKGYYRYKQDTGALYRSVSKKGKIITIGNNQTRRLTGKNSPFNYAAAVEYGAPRNIFGGKARIPFDSIGRSIRALDKRMPGLIKKSFRESKI